MNTSLTHLYSHAIHWVRAGFFIFVPTRKASPSRRPSRVLVKRVVEIQVGLKVLTTQSVPGGTASPHSARTPSVPPHRAAAAVRTA